jgi:hypothetical protein
MKPGDWGLPDGVADVDYKHSSSLAAKYVKICDVEAKVLPSDG